jgi:hypothetical protein
MNDTLKEGTVNLHNKADMPVDLRFKSLDVFSVTGRHNDCKVFIAIVIYR